MKRLTSLTMFYFSFEPFFCTWFVISSAIDIYLKDATSNKSYLGGTQTSAEGNLRRKIYGGVVDVDSLKVHGEKRDMFFVLSFLIHNAKPVGHQVSISLSLSLSSPPLPLALQPTPNLSRC